MQEMSAELKAYMRTIGRKGGQKSRRSLRPEQAREMVRVREAGRLYRLYHDACFWSSPVTLRITQADVPWVVEQLKKHGGRRGWLAAEKLCR